MADFVRFNCPNRFAADSDKECGHLLGGVALDTLYQHDREHPYVDLRFCKDCKCYYIITIAPPLTAPHFELVPEDAAISWLALEDEFPLMIISGDRPKKEVCRG